MRGIIQTKDKFAILTWDGREISVSAGQVRQISKMTDAEIRARLATFMAVSSEPFDPDCWQVVISKSGDIEEVNWFQYGKPEGPIVITR